MFSNTSTWIDHVYSNFDCLRLSTEVITSNVSDHFSTLTNICGIAKTVGEPELFYRKTNLTEKEWEKFNYDLYCSLANESALDAENYDVDVCANKISCAYKSLVDKYMPLTKRQEPSKKKKSWKPWITPGLIISSDKKFELLDKARITRDPDDYQKYKKYLNVFTRTKDQARENYY